MRTRSQLLPSERMLTTKSSNSLIRFVVSRSNGLLLCYKSNYLQLNPVTLLFLFRRT